MSTGLVPLEMHPAPGLLTGGQPSEEQLVAAREAGYSTILDLRGETEDRGFDEPARAASLGMTYVAIPMEGAAGLTEANARRLADALETAEGPTIVHCASGNRVGALFALKAFALDGATPEDALQQGLETGLTGLEGRVRELLGLA